MQAGSQIKHENSAVFSNIFFTGTRVIYPSRAAFLTASSENEKGKKREMKEKKRKGKKENYKKGITKLQSTSSVSVKL